MARFEVLGLDADRELIRSLAKRLAGDGPDLERIRATIRLTISGEKRKGGILAALRRSPAVGAGLDLSRPLALGRRVYPCAGARRHRASEGLAAWMSVGTGAGRRMCAV